MFTIKHVDSRFNEFAIEAQSYSHTVGHGQAVFSAYAGPHRDGECLGIWTGEPYDYKTPDSDAIYVMNRYGATVATYHFYAPCAGASLIDPASLQAA
jgi:hypothetical protein